MRTFPLPVLALLLGVLAVPAAEPAEGVWWSLRPLAKPAVPEARAQDKSWVRTPIDAFILAKLREKGFSPAPEADRRTLIRRLTFDLIGLPPTPEEVAAFEKDPDPNAYEKLVDRLLTSPHYGERWARHWMDVAHFAETHGHDQDRVRPDAWPYRDYLIESFNADTPYRRFVKEQIAADVLFPQETRLIPALGFLAAGPWDESSLRDIREDSIDREAGRYLDRDDIVTTVAGSFLSVTAHCARCHDHKFDPITQEDYYALQAVFAGVGRGVKKYDPDSAVAKKRIDLAAMLASIDKGDAAAVAKTESPEFRKEIAKWEAVRRPTPWEVLEPVRVESANGATLTVQPDKSVISGGKKPERDTVTFVARTRMKKVAAVRLELIPDESLPLRGPGRQDNGNLHLSEFRATAAVVTDGKPEAAKPVTFRTATADFDQDGWTVRHALDGDPKTAWGIYPQIGKPHEAVFELAEPVGDGETEFTFTLEQLHGGGHLIGRFRLAVSDDVRPLKAPPVPGNVSAVLAVSPGKRTAEQWKILGIFVLRERTAAELAALPTPRPVYVAAKDFEPDGSHKPSAKPCVVRLLKRGDIRKPGDEVEPGALSCLPNLPSRFELVDASDEGSRRAALANWLTDRENPLFWRSIVNRVWHHHFGRGICDTPNDLGKMGGKPTHPELLDWLAVEFRDGGGSFKKLHRLIVTSAVYRQSSRHDPKFGAVDGDNHSLWRAPRSRLDAEQVRDAILQVSGRLDTRRGGPSDQQFRMTPGVHVTPNVHYTDFKWDRPEGHRRSVYRFVFRTLPDPLVDCLDGADASQSTPARNTSVTAPQALSLLNNEFVLAHAKALAADLEKRSPERELQIALACERLWARAPTAAEKRELLDYAKKHGMPAMCRLLLNSNEFLFVD